MEENEGSRYHPFFIGLSFFMSALMFLVLFCLSRSSDVFDISGPPPLTWGEAGQIVAFGGLAVILTLGGITLIILNKLDKIEKKN